MFYGFNSRMIPDSVEECKPVYRKLNPRTKEEQDLIEAIEKKKRKKSGQQAKAKSTKEAKA